MQPAPSKSEDLKPLLCKM